ncbi:hypothetical protein HK100_012045 [Physocladia obscura]|uniref:AB hydrolase-1 domain-containing protein n=1 Tax=Physocladia obscura TaxID=109957 RepID=A0AAD5XHW4_9FUNG|nr:hypothetical protein HK100_012045 [Physocladia obscura]
MRLQIADLRIEPRICSRIAVDRDTEIHYEVYGADIAPIRLLLVNGVQQSCRMWILTVYALLRAQPKRVQICVFDGRGVGNSVLGPALENQRFSTKDLAADALLLLNHLGWSKDVWLLGCMSFCFKSIP